jgi:hypothetical protein
MAQRKPKKPVQYPKKFRQRLEKMGNEREQREAAPTPEEFDAWFNEATDVVIRELFLPETVHFSHARFDDVQRRITVRHTLVDPIRFDYVCVPPPWLRKPETPTSK